MNVGKKGKNAHDFDFLILSKKGKKTPFSHPLITHVWVAKLFFFAFFVIFLQLCKDNIRLRREETKSTDLANSKIAEIDFFSKKS